MDSNLENGVRLASGVLVSLSAFALLVWGVRRLRRPQIEFLDLVYDRAARQLELFVVNEGERSVYVNPSLRLVHFLDPEEWREKKSNGNGNGNGVNMVEGKCYQVDSVIKGYTLIGECSDSLKVDGRTVRKIIYPLGGDVNIRLYDNIRVDCLYGPKRTSDDRLINTMRVVLKDDVECGVFDGISSDNSEPVPNELAAPEEAVDLNPTSLFDAPPGGFRSADNILVEAPAEGFDDYNPNFCVLPGVRDEYLVVESRFPIQAVCVCCGKDRMLEWIVDGNHVCGECKDFMEEKVSGISILPECEAESFVEAVEDAPGKDASPSVRLKPRQSEILSLLEHENNLPIKKISRMLSINQSTAAADLKFLMKNELVGRIQVGRKHLYHLT